MGCLVNDSVGILAGDALHRVDAVFHGGKNLPQGNVGGPAAQAVTTRAAAHAIDEVGCPQANHDLIQIFGWDALAAGDLAAANDRRRVSSSVIS